MPRTGTDMGIVARRRAFRKVKPNARDFLRLAYMGEHRDRDLDENLVEVPCSRGQITRIVRGLYTPGFEFQVTRLAAYHVTSFYGSGAARAVKEMVSVCTHRGMAVFTPEDPELKEVWVF
jgi:hypothetical protein